MVSSSQPPVTDSTVSARWWRSSWLWIILSVVVVIAAAIAGAYFFFAAPIPDGPPDTTGMSPEAAAREVAAAEMEIARLRTEARRNALALGAGLAALAALGLAVRRQYHHERATARSQEEERRRQEHLEEDSLQRRITDSRIRAVEQLGSDNPAVRIGGLHNLERIGQVHQELRQVVLDEICSYLRLPYTPPSSASEPKAERLPDHQFEPVGPPPAAPSDTAGDEAEGEVRLIAQEILQRHLDPDKKDLYWEHSRLNLRNARLDNMDLGGCHLKGADFTETIFSGGVSFRGAEFSGGVNFRGAEFRGFVSFRGAEFRGGVSFGGAKFRGGVNFRGAEFSGFVSFEGAEFRGFVNFEGAKFRGDVNFRRAKLTPHMRFEDSRFRDALRVDDPIMLETMRTHGILLCTDINHQLPAGWDLAPDAADSAWGRLVDPSRPEQDRPDA